MTRRRLRVGARVVVLAASLLACGRTAVMPDGPTPTPGPGDAWSAAEAAVQEAVSAGRYGEADSALAAFVTRHVGVPEAGEARFWRALVQLDPANPAASPRAAIAALDAYLAGGVDQPRFAEALVLRRAASTLPGARPPVPQPAEVAPAPPAVDVERLRLAEDSVRILRLELERAQAELERIRRRLRPGPPGGR